jgi:hypothetical protein
MKVALWPVQANGKSATCLGAKAAGDVEEALGLTIIGEYIDGRWLAGPPQPQSKHLPLWPLMPYDQSHYVTEGHHASYPDRGYPAHYRRGLHSP